MFLVKCKCGCMFTIKKENIGYARITCQNCREHIPLDKNVDINNSKDLFAEGVSVNYIPDNAKITVTFDV